MAHGAEGVDQVLAHGDAVLIHRGVERGPATLGERGGEQKGTPHFFPPPADPAWRRRCCSARVSRSRRSMELRICSAWLWERPGRRVSACRCCSDWPPPPGDGGVAPPPPPPPGGGGPRRAASSRFHVG